jgi:hypothetical protein
MLKRNILCGATLAVLGLGSAALAADNAPVFVGGHVPVQQFRQEKQPQTQVPYALTGSEQTARPQKMVEIRVGSRIVAVQPVNQ